jgi:hypothetical protein
MTNNAFRGRFAQMAQLGQSTGVQVVAIAGLVAGNQYHAQAHQFDADGQIELADDDLITVINLAEPEDSDGQLPTGTPVTAVDVEGRWVIYARPFENKSFVAEIVSDSAGAFYSVSPMDPTTSGSFEARGGSVNAQNLWELNYPSASDTIPSGMYVLVTVVEAESDPGTIAYVFSEPPFLYS